MIKQLHDAIANVCPINGVSVGRKADKFTWRINFKPEAADEQKKAALVVIDGFDINTPEPVDQLKEFIEFLKENPARLTKLKALLK